MTEQITVPITSEESAVRRAEEDADFQPIEMVSPEEVMPGVGIRQSQRVGNLSGEFSTHIQAVDGVDIEQDAVKVLPEHIAVTAAVNSGDFDKSINWLSTLKGRVAKLKK